MHDDQTPERTPEEWTTAPTTPTATGHDSGTAPVVPVDDAYGTWPTLAHDPGAAPVAPPSAAAPWPGQMAVPPVAPPAAAPGTGWGAPPTAPGAGWGPPPTAPGSWGSGPGGPVPPWTPYGYYAAPPQPPVAPQHTGRRTLALLATVVAVLALGVGAAVGHATWPTDTNSATGSSGGSNSGGGGTSFPFGLGGSGSSSGTTSTGAGAPADISGVAAKISPALVDINTNLSYQNQQAAGTGIVLTSNGEILTNNHVIDGATSITATDVGNGQTYKANVVGYDRTGDIAVIQLVGASHLTTAQISPTPPVVGQAVVGVGNAGGTGGTPSAAGGSVTAMNQSITASDSGGSNSENLTGLIETNCDIQPGDSGGALVTESGKVLGMDTAASANAASQGAPAQSYAIPIGRELVEARQIEAGQGSNTIHIGATGFLGIQVQDQSALGNQSNGTPGAPVVGTLPNSPGAAAGLVEGDVITGFDGSPVNMSSDLTSLLESHHPGDVVHLTWTDQNGQTQTAPVTLAVGPPA